MTASSKNQPSVWLEFSPLAKSIDSINLGQGFPDWAPPPFVEKSAINAVQGKSFSTYARSSGHLQLVKQVAISYERKLNHTIDPTQEVLVTVGASEAIYLSIQCFIKPEDEVIIFEPAFDIYLGALATLGASVKSVPLSGNDDMESSSEFTIPWDTLQKTLNSRTKAIILNSPHNPSGKVFSKQELQKLADMLSKYPDTIVISDEVYEHLVYDQESHTPFASLTGMWDRTLSIYSAGKTFSTTGWKIGWIIGPHHLISPLQHLQQWIVFSVATPLQQAIAEALAIAEQPYEGFSSYYAWLRTHYQAKRDLLKSGMQSAGLPLINSQGTFFSLCHRKHFPDEMTEFPERLAEIYAKYSIASDTTSFTKKDYNIARQLSLTAGVTTIPVSAFSLSGTDDRWIRFAFCKEDATLRDAIDRISAQPLFQR